MDKDARDAMFVLKQLWQINHRIDEIYERIARCREMAMRATSTISATNVSGGKGRSKVESAVVTITDLETQLDASIDRLVKNRLEIQNAIESIPQEEDRRILELRYIDHLAWEAVMQKMHISRPQSFRIHARALTEFWQRYKR